MRTSSENVAKIALLFYLVTANVPPLTARLVRQIRCQIFDCTTLTPVNK